MFKDYLTKLTETKDHKIINTNDAIYYADALRNGNTAANMFWKINYLSAWILQTCGTFFFFFSSIIHVYIVPT